jgi:tetratricopeptide (TPR) repeat protein
MSRVMRGPAWPQLRWLALLWIALGLGGCVMFREPVGPPTPPAHPAPGAINPGSAIASPDTAASAAPAPPATATPAPTPPAGRQFHLGAAATALVAQAHRQAAGGDPQLAISTLERALRIEPDNPLLWIELGDVHEAAGHFEQAGGMGHKALQLATGDPHAQAASWRLIADSLKARNRNGEAAEAQHRADELSAQ